MNDQQLPSGGNLRQAPRLAQRLGCSVEPRRGTGELLLRHPSSAKPVRLNGRRKDTPRAVTAFLRFLIRETGNGPHRLG